MILSLSKAYFLLLTSSYLLFYDTTAFGLPIILMNPCFQKIEFHQFDFKIGN